MSETYGVPYAGPRFTDRWGHRSPALLSASIVAAIALGIRPANATPLTALAAMALLVFVLVTWLLMRQHDRRLCESCVAELPLNAAQAASKYHRRFWAVHAGSNPWILGPYLVALVGTNFLMSPLGRIAWAVMQASMVFLILSHTTHRRLQPWCGWCSGGGGGTDRIVDTPVLPRDDRTLV